MNTKDIKNCYQMALFENFKLKLESADWPRNLEFGPQLYNIIEK